jgi:hypothetical protein
MDQAKSGIQSNRIRIDVVNLSVDELDSQLSHHPIVEESISPSVRTVKVATKPATLLDSFEGF